MKYLSSNASKIFVGYTMNIGTGSERGSQHQSFSFEKLLGKGHVDWWQEKCI
jgi:hypothetical protein